MSALTAAVAANVPPEMMLEISLGIEDPFDVAQRFGFSAEDYARLVTLPWFLKTLSNKHKDLEGSGYTARARFAMLAEDILICAYRKAKESDSASLMLDVGKTLAKLADMEPKNINLGNAGGGGPQFTITINIPTPSAATYNPLKAEPAPTSEKPVIDLKPVDPEPDPLANRPTHVTFSTPNFDLAGVPFVSDSDGSTAHRYAPPTREEK